MIRGLVAGVLGLSALEVVLSTDAAANRAGGLLTGISVGVSSFLSPYTPAFRDHRTALPSLASELAGAPSTAQTPYATGKAPAKLPAWTQPTNPQTPYAPGHAPATLPTWATGMTKYGATS